MSEPSTDSASPARPCLALGVTGGIAAYKAADLTSQLVQAGLDVHVLMTPNATRLVAPRTFLTLSRNPVTTDLWDVPAWQPEHIELAMRAQVLLVAPATANFLGKYAHGIADDALTTFALSHTGPVILAPAMNPRMWAHPAVQANVQILRGRGIVFVGPDSGRVACGEDGPGRLATLPAIRRAVEVQFAALAAGGRAAKPRRILVTAGPTHEAIDPVRYIANRSSGKMGYAVAEVAAAAGHDVVLISGPTALPKPAGCRCVDVVSAADMAAAVRREFPACNLLVMTAAVADYRPRRSAARKIKKSAATLALDLERTEDILTAVAADKRPGQVLVGFAAETENLLAAARGKLRRKQLDFIVANDVSRSDIGFGVDANEVTVISRRGQVRLAKQSKLTLAADLLRLVTDST